MKKEKKFTVTLEFYLRGKKKIPSVGFDAPEDPGIPFTSCAAVPGTPEGDAFDAFNIAAHEFCKQLKIHGELG